MSTPETKGEIERGIIDACSSYVLAADRERLADLVWGWLAEARANATPRLRPVSEKPNASEKFVVLMNDGEWIFGYRDGIFSDRVRGWILLERAKPKTLAEEARELLAPPAGEMNSGAWIMEARRILSRVAEQGESWRRCPSTHCERRGECASPHECIVSGARVAEDAPQMAEAQIRHMTNRFLRWRLPKDFRPDGGISVDESVCALGTPNGPVGTNLLDAVQAEEMVRFMLRGEENRDE